MISLSGKVAIVTGASSGIGYATSILFAQQGAKVIVAARRQLELDKLVDEISTQGGNAVALAGDVKDEKYASALVELATKHFGGVDIAFNNAGSIGNTDTISNTTLEDWNHTMNTNLNSAFFAAKYQLPAMLKRGAGSLIFTSTVVGYTMGMPEMAAYSASKSALMGLTKSLASEYGSQGIRVNVLVPGGTDTPMGRSFAHTPEIMQYVQNLHALKRLALPEEIAKSALYLASDLSSFTTGTALLVDGGSSIHRS